MTPTPRSPAALRTRGRAPAAPPPLAQLTFYPDTILVTKYTPSGTTTHPVHPADVAAAFTNTSLTSGLLPPNTLCYLRTGGKIGMAVLVPAAKYTVQVETSAGIMPFTIPLPPLVWIGRGSRYSVFALKEDTPLSTATLYTAPCSNVSADGNVCHGNTPFPETTPDTIYRAFRTFIEGSTFNADHSANRVTGKHTRNVLYLWQELHERKTRRFPVRALQPTALTLGRLIQTLHLA